MSGSPVFAIALELPLLMNIILNTANNLGVGREEGLEKQIFVTLTLGMKIGWVEQVTCQYNPLVLARIIMDFSGLG